MVNSIKIRLKNIKLDVLFVLGITLVVGIIFGIFINQYFNSNFGSSVSTYSIRLYDPNYKLILPLLISDSGIPGNKLMENKLKLQTYDLLNIPDVQTISIYYRDLKTGIWTGIGENTEYDPGSLLKVPIMIAWFRKAQDNPSVLSQELLFTGPTSSNGKEFSLLTKGQSYTVNYLINSMITKSDNDAKDVLLANIESSLINTTFTDLGIETWGNVNGSSKHISANIYSRFFRILYNSTYLNHEFSEKALEMLSSTNFNDGLRAGVPSVITVAHKFGQYQVDPNSPIELHDCGIVYHPVHPYLLCVMTRGLSDINISTLESVIQNVSRTVYSMVDSNEMGLPKSN